MIREPATLSFCWWNLHDFAHFDPAKASDPRWPKRREDFEAKRDRVLAALKEMFDGGFPDLAAICEVTREAAQELGRGLSPDFDVATAPTYPRDDGFQVAVIYRKGFGFSADVPLLPSEILDVPEETRPMIPVNHSSPSGQEIRFVACHWTSFDAPSSRSARRRLADYLRGDIYEFLNPDESRSRSGRHAVVLGDLNEEPTSEIFQDCLSAARDCDSSRRPAHWRHRQVRRVHLYDASWRFLGEQSAYGGGPQVPSVAGTFYNKEMGWRTFDHLIVSGGLLSEPPPYLDEEAVRVVATTAMRSADGKVRPFATADAPGISDHLPIVGRIRLSEDVA